MRTFAKSVLAFVFALSFISFFLLNRLALTIEGLEGRILETLPAAMDMLFPTILAQPFQIGTSKLSLMYGTYAAAAVWLIYLYCAFGSKKYMRGIEHGSATWGTAKDIAPFMNPDQDQNIILSASEQLNMKKAKKFENDRNKNVIVVGGSGSGKTYSEVKPNLMQLHSSYVCTDPKGTILPETGFSVILAIAVLSCGKWAKSMFTTFARLWRIVTNWMHK